MVNAGKLNNLSGQSLVEACAVLAVVALMTAITTPTLGLISARLWLTNVLYDRLRCELAQNSDTEKNQCNQKMLKQVRPIWWGHFIQNKSNVQTLRFGRVATLNAIWCNSSPATMMFRGQTTKLNYYAMEKTSCPKSQILKFNLKIRESQIKDSHLWH